MVRNQKSGPSIPLPRIAKNFLKRHLLRDLPAKLVRRWVDRELGSNTVLGGPFRNMKYNDWTRLSGLAKASAYYPKLLGTYEIEIVSFIRRITDLGIGRIVVVGAGEGYYAVGLARLLNARVVAFEAQARRHFWNWPRSMAFRVRFWLAQSVMLQLCALRWMEATGHVYLWNRRWRIDSARSVNRSGAFWGMDYS